MTKKLAQELIIAWRDFERYVVENQPNYVDADFSFENFIRYLQKTYDRNKSNSN